MSTVYINKSTNTMIDDAFLVFNDDNGIILNKNNCWQLIPPNRVRKENSYNEYFPEWERPVFRHRHMPEMTDYVEDSDAYVDIIRQEFGFENFVICTRHPQEVSGLISKPIAVNEASYIQIEAACEGEAHGSVEFYIVDGTQEVPILPKDQKTVMNEKMFYGMDLRFRPDMLQGNLLLYEDGVGCEKDYQNLTAADFADHQYRITYVVAGDNATYFPNNDTVRIKIVVRQYDREPVSVQYCIIHKFGETVSWTSAQSN